MVVHACRPSALGRRKQEDQKVKVLLSSTVTPAQRGLYLVMVKTIWNWMLVTSACFVTILKWWVFHFKRVNFMIDDLYGFKKSYENGTQTVRRQYTVTWPLSYVISSGLLGACPQPGWAQPGLFPVYQFSLGCVCPWPGTIALLTPFSRVLPAPGSDPWTNVLLEYASEDASVSTSGLGVTIWQLQFHICTSALADDGLWKNRH